MTGLSSRGATCQTMDVRAVGRRSAALPRLREARPRPAWCGRCPENTSASAARNRPSPRARHRRQNAMTASQPSTVIVRERGCAQSRHRAAAMRRARGDSAVASSQCRRIASSPRSSAVAARVAAPPQADARSSVVVSIGMIASRSADRRNSHAKFRPTKKQTGRLQFGRPIGALSDAVNEAVGY